MTALAPNAPVTPTIRLRLTRRGRRVVGFLAAVPLVAGLAAFAVFGASSAIATADAGSADFSYITVQSGQSLWSIAQSIDPKADPRDVIADIVNLNQLHSSSVQPGQRLALPAEYSTAK
ncbi:MULTISPECIES: LysM peptidoglycan-binding domain-containing protein [Subtercola]|uniref:LysM peptidoglycan-binding domain-containing protein n=1 Tax=Subtercola vilae TaxID=2056433 RepID=A0A4T2BU44_9MICO|nr:MULTISPECIES: LysM peptidoglycan-binding domain-containing protein [Subtercola]MEA9985305.1 LysM peptidoglycan-binding domain-containing protein [Subtercola sp. RTI3]TIH34619.1 LysM peptidoglycan-binding domain-containing protein [Subtercola vilae]